MVTILLENNFLINYHVCTETVIWIWEVLPGKITCEKLKCCTIFSSRAIQNMYHISAIFTL